MPVQRSRIGPSDGQRAVEHGRDDPRRSPTPVAVDVAAQQVVQQVVPRGDLAEHPADAVTRLVDAGSGRGGVGGRVGGVTGAASCSSWETRGSERSAEGQVPIVLQKQQPCGAATSLNREPHNG